MRKPSTEMWGTFGFLVTNGICEDGVSWLDHEYDAYEDLEDCAGWIDDVLGFVLGEVNGKYRTVNGAEEKKQLFWAAQNGDLALIQQLLDEDVDIDSTSETGATALFDAIRCGQIEAVKLLLERGADVNAEDEDNDTALTNAAYYGHLDIIEVLMKHGAELEDANDTGYTSLIMATWQGQTEAVRLFLKYGAEVNAKTDDGETALSLASTDEIKKLLIDAGAKAEN